MGLKAKYLIVEKKGINELKSDQDGIERYSDKEREEKMCRVKIRPRWD